MMGSYFYDNGAWVGHGLWMLVFAAVIIVPAWRLCQRLGYPGWMGILILVPMINLILFYALAFGQWPIDDRTHTGFD